VGARAWWPAGLALAALVGGCAQGAPGRAGCPASAAEPSITTTLFFGLAMPDGAVVGPAAWQAFLDGTVTPLFPAGFTVLDAAGQYLMQGAPVPIREPARLLVLSHRGTEAETAAIERVRAEYRRRFRQESVLRIDGAACRGF
jgi:Protein of unknown function (DUF3574)